MNELSNLSENNISSNNIMNVSNYYRKKVRQHFNLTPKQGRDYQKETDIQSLDDAYLSLQILMNEETGKTELSEAQKKAQKKEANRIRNIRYRERKRSKESLNKLMLDTEGFKQFNINLTNKGLNNDFSEVLKVLNSNQSRDLVLKIGSGTFAR